MNYLPLNKFYARSEEMGETPITKNICDQIIYRFFDKCYQESINPYVCIWGISRRLSGNEIKNLLKEGGGIEYSYYNKDSRGREYSTAFSFDDYSNLRSDGIYQIEVNITQDTFIIFRVD